MVQETHFPKQKNQGVIRQRCSREKFYKIRVTLKDSGSLVAVARASAQALVETVLTVRQIVGYTML